MPVARQKICSRIRKSSSLLLLSIALCLSLSGCMPVFWAAVEPTINGGGGGGQSLADAALKEYDSGVADGTMHEGGTQYKSWYGLNDEWCAMFVSYCANECGFIDSGLIGKTAMANGFGNFVKANGDKGANYAYGDAAFTPQPGDIIWRTDYSVSTHVGIVVEVDTVNSTLKTVEGNTGLPAGHASTGVNMHTASYGKYNDGRWNYFTRFNFPASAGAHAFGEGVDFSMSETDFVAKWGPIIKAGYEACGHGGCPLAAYSDDIARAGFKHQLDPRVIACISMAESSGGSAVPANAIYNAWGWSVYTGSQSSAITTYFNTDWLTAIDYFARAMTDPSCPGHGAWAGQEYSSFEDLQRLGPYATSETWATTNNSLFAKFGS